MISAPPGFCFCAKKKGAEMVKRTGVYTVDMLLHCRRRMKVQSVSIILGGLVLMFLVLNVQLSADVERSNVRIRATAATAAGRISPLPSSSKEESGHGAAGQSFRRAVASQLHVYSQYAMKYEMRRIAREYFLRPECRYVHHLVLSTASLRCSSGTLHLLSLLLEPPSSYLSSLASTSIVAVSPDVHTAAIILSRGFADVTIAGPISMQLVALSEHFSKMCTKEGGFAVIKMEADDDDSGLSAGGDGPAMHYSKRAKISSVLRSFPGTQVTLMKRRRRVFVEQLRIGVKGLVAAEAECTDSRSLYNFHDCNQYSSGWPGREEYAQQFIEATNTSRANLNPTKPIKFDPPHQAPKGAAVPSHTFDIGVLCPLPRLSPYHQSEQAHGMRLAEMADSSNLAARAEKLLHPPRSKESFRMLYENFLFGELVWLMHRSTKFIYVCMEVLAVDVVANRWSEEQKAAAAGRGGDEERDEENEETVMLVHGWEVASAAIQRALRYWDSLLNEQAHDPPHVHTPRRRRASWRIVRNPFVTAQTRRAMVVLEAASTIPRANGSSHYEAGTLHASHASSEDHHRRVKAPSEIPSSSSSTFLLQRRLPKMKPPTNIAPSPSSFVARDDAVGADDALWILHLQPWRPELELYQKIVNDQPKKKSPPDSVAAWVNATQRSILLVDKNTVKGLQENMPSSPNDQEENGNWQPQSTPGQKDDANVVARAVFSHRKNAAMLCAVSLAVMAAQCTSDACRSTRELHDEEVDVTHLTNNKFRRVAYYYFVDTLNEEEALQRSLKRDSDGAAYRHPSDESLPSPCQADDVLLQPALVTTTAFDFTLAAASIPLHTMTMTMTEGPPDVSSFNYVPADFHQSLLQRTSSAPHKGGPWNHDDDFAAAVTHLNERSSMTSLVATAPLYEFLRVSFLGLCRQASARLASVTVEIRSCLPSVAVVLLHAASEASQEGLGVDTVAFFVTAQCKAVQKLLETHFSDAARKRHFDFSYVQTRPRGLDTSGPSTFNVLVVDSGAFAQYSRDVAAKGPLRPGLAPIEAVEFAPSFGFMYVVGGPATSLATPDEPLLPLCSVMRMFKKGMNEDDDEDSDKAGELSPLLPSVGWFTWLRREKLPKLHAANDDENDVDGGGDVAPSALLLADQIIAEASSEFAAGRHHQGGGHDTPRWTSQVEQLDMAEMQRIAQRENFELIRSFDVNGGLFIFQRRRIV